VAQVQYWIEIGNDYLGKYRRVTGRTRREVELKAAEQLQRWSEQETRARHREAVADAKEEAAAATDEAQALIAEYRTILHATLAVDDRLDWGGMAEVPRFSLPEPDLAGFRRSRGVPAEKPVLERLRLASKDRRIQAEQQAQEAYEIAMAEHAEAQRRHQATVDARASEVGEFRTSYEAGDPDAVERYVSLVLASSAFPSGFARDCEVAYSADDKSLVVEAELPVPEDLPGTVEYRFIASRGAIEEKTMKERDRAELYEGVVIQTALRTIHEIFEGDYAGNCQLVVFNGMVSAVDRGTGQDYRACIASCQTTREEFEQIDLSRVEPRDCFRKLKGLAAAKLVGLQPVQPIRVLNREDPRFIEAGEVITGLEADQNLMTMEWQDFEVLVRDLFDEMFRTKGAEVKVTRTSRDQGVDAVVFDPDPLLGGKTVIQAKRYRHSVPVAAVRELYGTMMNEGAGKGILVTTSHFGASAQEFIKDKPITLLDGANLLHLLQNHGHRVRIDLSEGKAEEDLLTA
jgi:restriction system protein